MPEEKAQEQNKSSKQEKNLDSALKQSEKEMENDHVVDETAATVVYAADIGHSAHALVKGPTTSPQIIERSRYERAKNADPDAENKRFARDVLGLDVKVDDEPDGPEEVYGGQRADQ